MILPLSDCHMEMLASTVYMPSKLNMRNSSELCFVLRRKDGAIGRRRRRNLKAPQKVRLNTSNTCIINRFF
jgi:hypothetical protein